MCYAEERDYFESNFVRRDNVLPRDCSRWGDIADWMEGLQEAIEAGDKGGVACAVEELCGYLDCKYILKKIDNEL